MGVQLNCQNCGRALVSHDPGESLDCVNQKAAIEDPTFGASYYAGSDRQWEWAFSVAQASYERGLQPPDDVMKILNTDDTYRNLVAGVM